MLLVTGASGQLGSRVHARLLAAGVPALAGSRDPRRLGAGARALDFDDPATLDLSGVQTLVLVSAGYAEDDVVIARHDRVITAAEDQGVRHVVYTSLTAAGDHLGFALAHRWTERRLRAGRLGWTVLRNGLYAELFGRLASPLDGAVTAPFGDGALAAVAREDLAEVTAVVAADAAAHHGQTYELAGTAAFTAADLARAWGVARRPVSLQDHRAALAGAGLLPFQPPMLLSLFSAVAGGFLAGTVTDLPRLLPRRPLDALAVAVAAGRPSAVVG
ncbi:NAD(P)H-binding protein [Modestobacter roseus]|uniref:NAD(P)H dehydrogenase (Quinone) n=1 Tax=Modestobacter roseus TaxID=1181884 RepID=A0A562ITH4_9ACTN|nr:NAD(P)H-binding protein [Modestobacter roseus]MQA33846.1 NAD(P)H-binding protein [Modestobacter roseus]TWH73985.1 NAD(P)H dehydrogenase (quinone) [Modestobacter roseus]